MVVTTRLAMWGQIYSWIKAAQYFSDLPVLLHEFKLIINFMMDDIEFVLMSKEAAYFISLEDIKTLFYDFSQ